VDQPLLAAGLSPASIAVDYVTNSNFQAGGAVIKDKLFYFGSLNYQPTHVNVISFPAVVPSYIASPLSKTSTEDTTDILAGSGKTTWQLNSKNRFEVYLSKQRYDKPNRGAGTGSPVAGTQDSDSKELDTFVIAQGSWNLILSNFLSADTRLSYNNTHFPLLQKTKLQPITDTVANILYRNRNSSALMFRRRLQAVSNWQYFLPRFVAGRHEFKWGIDNGYTPADVTTSRVDDVNLSFNSTTGAPVRVTLFNSPTLTKSAVNTTAIYGQDSYTYRRLTVTGGVRWERLEGFLPAQNHLTSKYFAPGSTFNNVSFSYVLPNGQPVTVTGPYTVPDHYDAVRNAPLWKNAAGRISATFDLSGTGKTVVKVSGGKYLDQINTGTVANPNGTISQQYVWNDVNSDYTFQPGTLTWNGTNYVGGAGSGLGAFVSGSNSIANPYGPLTFNKSLKRPSRNEFTIGLDRELFPNSLLGATFIHRREHNQQSTADANINQWSSMYTKVTLTEPGPDGKIGEGDDRQIVAYSLNPGVTVSNITLSDDRLSQHYNGFELAFTKRFSKGWTALIGYDYGHTRQDILGLQNPNQVFVNASGVSGGRRHLINGSASYTLPWFGLVLATEFRIQSGLPITRQWVPDVCSPTVTTNCLTQSLASLPLNVESRGSRELPWLSSGDARVGKTFRLERHTFDVSMDTFNITNANTVYAVNTLSNTRQVRYGGDPKQPVTTIANFLSPTGVLGPRIVRLNLTYTFSQQ